jgi:hypothetical protein
LFRNDCDQFVFFEPRPGWGGGVHVVYASYVEALILKHTQSSWSDFNYFDTFSIEPGFDQDFVGDLGPVLNDGTRFEPGLVYVTPHTVSYEQKVGKNKYKQRLGASLRVFGFHLVEARTATAHSYQGAEVKFLLCLNIRTYYLNLSGFFYMLQTRVRHGSDFWLTQRIPETVVRTSSRPGGNAVELTRRWAELVERHRFRAFLCAPTYLFMSTLMFCSRPSQLVIPSLLTPDEFELRRHLIHDARRFDGMAASSVRPTGRQSREHLVYVNSLVLESIRDHGVRCSLNACVASYVNFKTRSFVLLRRPLSILHRYPNPL